MNKKAFNKSLGFIMFVLFLGLVILMSVMTNTINATAYTGEPKTDGNLENDTSVSVDAGAYEIRPIIERFSYSVNEIIPIEIMVETDSDIMSVSSSSQGFDVKDSLKIRKNRIIGSMTCDGVLETPHLTVYVVLANEVKLQAEIYGFASDGKVYINVNSFFGAKDIYWDEMLANGILTQVDYESYITNRVPSVSVEATSLSENIVSPMATKYQVTISGTLQWRDDWNFLHPLQFTKVQIMDEGGGWLFGWWDTELGTTYTNQAGFYSISFSHSGTCNPYLKIYPEGENSVVKTGSGKEYVKPTEPRKGVTTGTTINEIIDMSDDVGRAFQVSQAVIAASRFVQAVRGSYVDKVTVKYPHNENYTGCFYLGKTLYIVGNRPNDNIRIRAILLRSYASWDVIQHEYFHHVQDMLDLEDNPGDWHGPDTNMYTHYMSHHTSTPSTACLDSKGKITCANPTVAKAKDAAIKVAYAEAVASILGGIAQEYYVNLGILNNIETVGDTIYTSYNGAVMNYETVTTRVGEVNETTITGILWDIYDNVPDSRDNVSLGYKGFWDVVVRNNNKTLSDFILTLYQNYPSYKELIGESLSYYRVAASLKGISNNSLNTLPTFSWTANGSNSTQYENNIFEIIFYNSSKIEIFSKEVTGTTYTLTESEWNSILTTYGDHFYWTIKSSHKDNNSGLITGPYFSELFQVSKMSVPTITTGGSSAGTIASSGDYQWYKFVAPSAGTYTFYTEGTTDTYGDLFSQCFYGLGTTNRLVYNDDGGEGRNFKITYDILYNQTVYLRVRAYGSNTGSYTLNVNFDKHNHAYVTKHVLHDENNFYHKSYCDCGEYILVEHDFISIGTQKARCIECHWTISSQPPGAGIMSNEDKMSVDDSKQRESMIPKKYD